MATRRTKRGSALERGLAYTGIGLWVAMGAVALIPPRDYLAFGISALGVVAGIKELSRWQSGLKYSGTHRRSGTYVYPRWAWFAVGAVPAVFVTGIVGAATSGSAARTGAWLVIDILAWIAGGLAAENILTIRAARREAGDSDGVVPARPDL
jgi:hypothetical protein